MCFTLAKIMNTLLRLLLVIAAAINLVQAADPIVPPKELLAEWKKLQEKDFSNWQIKNFHGWHIFADGGSKGFSFESDTGERFELMVANPDYWTPDDKEARRQVFFVIYKTRFYRIDPKSEEEKNIIEKLTSAARRLSGVGEKDPKLLTTLAERLESREAAFKSKG
jgi:hypothetical protein